MDYRELLVKYIAYIRSSEGIDYVTECRDVDFRNFSYEEQKELIKLAEESKES